MIENYEILECDFSFKCPVKWENLAKLDDPNKRYCNSCEREVFYTRTQTELENNKKLGRCIAAKVAPGLVIAGGAETIEESSEDTTRLLILGTEENRSEVIQAIKKHKRKTPQNPDNS